MIGIPWKAKGRDRDGIDCVGLALMAQKELFGMEYNFPFDYDPMGDDEGVLVKWISTIADRVEEPIEGDVVIYAIPHRSGIKYHIGTVVSGGLLHIGPNSTSRIIRFNRKRIYGIYRGREVEQCQVQQ